MAALIVILILLAIIGTTSSVVAYRRKPGKPPAIKLGLLPMAPLSPPADQSGEPGFVVHKKLNPDFTIVSVTGKPPATPHHQAPTNHGPVMPGAHATNFSVTEVSQNLTAICFLTGKKAADCGCQMHKGGK